MWIKMFNERDYLNYWNNNNLIQLTSRLNQLINQSKYSLSQVLFGLVLWHINHCKLFNAKSIFIHINSFISTNSA